MDRECDCADICLSYDHVTLLSIVHVWEYREGDSSSRESTWSQLHLSMSDTKKGHGSLFGVK